MATLNEIVELNNQINSYGKAWKTASIGIGANLDKPLGAANNLVGAVSSGLQAIESILEALGIIVKATSFASDFWKNALDGIIDIAEGVLDDTSSIYWISIPPIVLVNSKDYNNVLEKNNINSILRSNIYIPQRTQYFNPITGMPIDGLYKYIGPQLFPFYTTLRNSVLDLGDINAPRVTGLNKFIAATGIVEVGSSIPALFNIASVLGPISPFLAPRINNVFNIDVRETPSKKALIVFEPKSVVNKIMGIVGFNDTLSIADYGCNIYIRHNLNGKVVRKINIDMLDVLKQNWTYIDNEAEVGKRLFYNAEIYSKKNIKIYLISNITSLYMDTIIPALTIPSMPPDWHKISLSRVAMGDYVDQILTFIKGLVNLLNSMVSSGADNVIRNIESVKAMLNNIKETIRRISDIINNIILVLKTIASLKVHALFSDSIEGDYWKLIEHYREILVENPPNIDTSSSEKIVYCFSALADSRMEPSLRAILSLFDESRQNTKYLIEKTIIESQNKISDFYDWLKLSHPELA